MTHKARYHDSPALQGLSLGKSQDYIAHYAPDLLQPVPRSLNREDLQLDATDGSILDTLTLTGGEGEESTLAIEGSPAVYGNLMIIGTTGKDAGGVYCIKIE